MRRLRPVCFSGHMRHTMPQPASLIISELILRIRHGLRLRAAGHVPYRLLDLVAQLYYLLQLLDRFVVLLQHLLDFLRVLLLQHRHLLINLIVLLRLLDDLMTQLFDLIQLHGYVVLKHAVITSMLCKIWNLRWIPDGSMFPAFPFYAPAAGERRGKEERIGQSAAGTGAVHPGNGWANARIHWNVISAKELALMPSIVGNVKIVNVGPSSVVQFGDAIQISPSSNSKTYAGAGSFLTGDLANSHNAVSATNTVDKDLQDTPSIQQGPNA